MGGVGCHLFSVLILKPCHLNLKPFIPAPFLYLFITVLFVVGSGVSRAAEGGVLIIAGDVVGSPNTVDFVNYAVNADIFYNAGYFGDNTVIANVEAGHIWGGHEVFDRSGFGLPAVPSVQLNLAPDPVSSPQLGEMDYHATMVGHVLAGTGDSGDGNLSFLGIGMAPFAGLWSGAIATSFSTENIGSFSFSAESFLHPYVGFFAGTTEHGKPDVINSSWGFSGSGDSFYTLAIDALASDNPTVASVISAGNSGPGAGTIGEPGAGFNSITVGAQSAAQFTGEVTGPTEFSSRGPVSFHNPVTNETIEDARVGVHIAAPGQNMALAAYLGDSGSLTGHELATEDPADDLYFTYSASGTSFAAPVVAGGIALLKDVAKGGVYLVDVDHALDSRVIRSVIMAGAVKTPGWDNGQSMVEGVIITERGLDFATGAGGLDLASAANIYALNTTNLAGYGGGVVSAVGWDFGTVDLGMANDYIFDSVFAPYTELTIALNWFANEEFDIVTNDLVADTASFANLDLEVWGLQDGIFTDLVAASISLYNSSEFLRIILEEGGEYGFRVTFEGIVYDATGLLGAEDYAIAWTTTVIPEPATILFVVAILGAALIHNRRRLRIGRHCDSSGKR